MVNKKSSKATKTKTAKKPVSKKPAVKKTTSAAAKKTVHATEPYHPAFGVIILIVCAIIVAVLLPFAVSRIAKMTESDAARFAGEYSLVESDNVFKYKSAEETEKILEHGTGVVFLGFPSCPWCQTYAKMLNDLAKEKGLKEIYYYNIATARENNTETYQKFVQILSDYLQYDNVGEKRIYVPNTTFVVDGEIVGNDWETSKDTLGLEKPEEYWTEERVAAWKEKVSLFFDRVLEKQGCTTACNE